MTNRGFVEFIPLNPGIKTAIRIIPEKETNCKRGGEYCILLYCEKKDGYLQNIGYLGEQLDLYLVSRNIGTLWFGIGKTKEEPFEDMDICLAHRGIDFDKILYSDAGYNKEFVLNAKYRFDQ